MCPICKGSGEVFIGFWIPCPHCIGSEDDEEEWEEDE